MVRSWFVLLVACGGSGRPVAREPVEDVGVALLPEVATRTWYRAPSICGQGPYEVEVPIAGAKYGEDVVVSLATPRRVALMAVVLGDDGAEVVKTAGLFDAGGRGQGAAENLRCVADQKERLAALRGGSGGGTVVPDVPTGTTVTVLPPPSTPIGLIVEDGEPGHSTEVVRFGWRETGRRHTRLRVRLWSVEPNDLEFVRFGVTRFEWRPNTSEIEYQAYSKRREKRVELQRESPEESHARWVRQNADAERQLREQAERDRRRALDAALETEKRRRRDAYCAVHADSRDCWGAGGKQRWAQMEELARQRTAFCAAHTEDVRCWSDAERARREQAWRRRIEVTVTPKLPDGPPPAPREETPPPKLSDNAEWRPGYWQWTGTTWLWLGGQWRVPDEDIVAERTTTAPSAPPPPMVETIPPPPTATIIWTAGFWQWNGSQWIWVPGGYQVRPSNEVTWRPTEWRMRGRVHVLVPGGWIRGRR
jgi:hypothetical protein